MTDSFADLWNAAAPTKPTQSQPQRVAQITPQPQQSRPQYDAFSILSAPTVSSTQTSRPLTSGQFSQTKTTSQHTPVSKSAISSGLGAFSDLLGSDIGSNPNVNLTIAQRAAKADKEKLTSVRGQQSSITQVSPSTWAGLDSLADLTLDSPTPHPNGPSSLRPARKSAPQTARQKTTPLVPVDDDWGLKDSVRTRTPPALAPVRSSLTQAPIPVTETKTLIWDLEDFSSGVNFASNNLINTSHAPLPTNRPGSFDFGDRNDQSINEVNSPTEDDILGDLGKPVEVIKQKQAASQVNILATIWTNVIQMCYRSQQRPKYESRPLPPVYAPPLPHHTYWVRLLRWASPYNKPVSPWHQLSLDWMFKLHLTF